MCACVPRQFCEEFKEKCPICVPCGLKLAEKTQTAIVRHFGLQILEHVVKYGRAAAAAARGRPRPDPPRPSGGEGGEGNGFGAGWGAPLAHLVARCKQAEGVIRGSSAFSALTKRLCVSSAVRALCIASAAPMLCAWLLLSSCVDPGDASSGSVVAFSLRVWAVVGTAGCRVSSSPV